MPHRTTTETKTPQCAQTLRFSWENLAVRPVRRCVTLGRGNHSSPLLADVNRGSPTHGPAGSSFQWIIPSSAHRWLRLFPHPSGEALQMSPRMTGHILRSHSCLQTCAGRGLGAPTSRLGCRYDSSTRQRARGGQRGQFRPTPGVGYAPCGDNCGS